MRQRHGCRHRFRPQQLQRLLRRFQAAGGVQARRQLKAHIVRAQFFRRLGHGFQGDDSRPLRGVQSFQTRRDQNPVFAGKRHQVRNGAERHQIQQRLQIEVQRAGQTRFASAFHKGMRQLERQAGGAQLLEIAACRLPLADCRQELRIHQRHGFWGRRGNLMVVEDDDFHPAFLQPRNGFDRRGTAIHRQQQFHLAATLVGAERTVAPERSEGGNFFRQFSTPSRLRP